MKTLQLALGIAVVSLVGSGIVTADPSAKAVNGKKKENVHEKLVFVTGSRIPQRIKVKAIGTNTTSPIRVYDREELDKIGHLPRRERWRRIRLSRSSDTGPRTGNAVVIASELSPSFEEGWYWRRLAPRRGRRIFWALG